MRQPSTTPDFAWVDDTGSEELLGLLQRHGSDVNTLTGSNAGQDDASAEESEAEALAAMYQLVPLSDGWLRIGVEEGRLVGNWIDNPANPAELASSETIWFDEGEADDLNGWVRARADIGGDGRRWVSVLRRPEREAYAAIVLDAGAEGPVRQRVVAGVYPDISLCDDGRLLLYVEPDRQRRGTTRAVLSAIDVDTEPYVVRESDNGGLGVRPCSVRRFVKLSHGVRTVRLWDLIDARSERPVPITVPGVPKDPDLIDVALLKGEPVLVQGKNLTDEGAEHWELVVSTILDSEVLDGWRATTGAGVIREVRSGDGCALIRVREDGVERVLRVAIEGFSTSGLAPLATSEGMFSLGSNSTTPAAGFCAIELSGGMDPFQWFWNSSGTSLNSPVQLANRSASLVRRSIETVVSPDGYEFQLDLRWKADFGDTFDGPVILMVYGAYGLDLDLDTDRDLHRWLDRGLAVGTPHVRGGGPTHRHLAGCRANRQRSLDDVAAAVKHIRSGTGAVSARTVAVLGASAGGFLAATTLNTCPELVDTCIIVNGYVDPLTSLLRRDTPTTASDQDEWGDPHQSPIDLATLQAISPCDNLVRAGEAKALVVISAQDVRVNPRQGLKWYLQYRELGGTGTLWFDPQGAHDCWGGQMHPEAMVDWVVEALTPAASYNKEASS